MGQDKQQGTAEPHKYFADQFDDEEVLLVFRKHPVVMRKGLILGLLAVLMGVIPSLFKPEYTVYLLGLGIGLVAGACYDLLDLKPFGVA